MKETSEEGWLHGHLRRTGQEGLFPDNYVELVYIEVRTNTYTLSLSLLPLDCVCRLTYMLPIVL